MTKSTLADKFSEEYFEALDETFNHVHGIYLDPGNSLFETLETITAEEASRPVGNSCATIAAQVDHVRFYLTVNEDFLSNKPIGKVDWSFIWNNTHSVTAEEWSALKQKLKEAYDSMFQLLRSFDTWEGENDISGVLGVLTHTAYHLGEIRQATCTITEH